MSRTSSWLEGLATGLLYCMLACLFFGFVTILHSHTFISWYDNVVQYYAWMTKVVTGWRHLAPALWDFNADSGIAFPGELQTGVFYPVNMLFAWLVGEPDSYKLDLLIVAHFAFGAWGMNVLLRWHGVGRLGSFLGGLVFCFLGPVANRARGQANIFVGLVYLPWILSCYAQGHDCISPSWRNSFYYLAGMFLGLSLLAGHPQPFIHATILLLCYSIFLIAQQQQKRQALPGCVARHIAALLCVFGATFLLTFIQGAASLEYFSRAYRWVGLPEPVAALQVVPYAAYKSHAITWHDLLTIFRAMRGIHDGATLFLTTIVLLLSIIGLCHKSPLRWFALSVALVSICIALGDNTWLGPISYRMPLLNKVREPARILFLYQFGMAALAALGLEYLLAKFSDHTIMKVLLFFLCAGVFLLEAHIDRMKFQPIISQENKNGDNFYLKNDIISFLENRTKEEGGMYRTLVRPKDLLPPNLGDVFYIRAIMGHRSSMLKNYFDYLSRDWSYGSKNLDLLSAKYIVTQEIIEGMPLLLHDRNMSIYERPHALPIFRVVTMDEKPSDVRMRDVQWRQNDVSFVLHTEEASSLIFAQPSYPGWKAKVNGLNSPISTSDIFMRIHIPAGENNIEWYYSPWWFPVGLAAWGGSIVLLIVCIVWSKYEKRVSA